jgi:hypothetical protein
MTKPSAKPSGETATKPKGRFRKVEVRTWGDAKFRALSPIPACGQGLWLYLITGPHTGPIPGLFRAGRAGMAEELGWELEAFDEALGEVLSQGLMKVDRKARVMWIPNAIKLNSPESPNVVAGWASEFELIPECELKSEAYEVLRAHLETVGPGFVAMFDRVINKPSPKPSDKPSVKTKANQEQEQDKQAGAGSSAPVGAGADAPPAQTGSAIDPETQKGLTAQQAADLTRTELWRAGKSLLAERGMHKDQCGTFVGKLVKDHGEDVVIAVVREAVVQRPADAATWLVAACRDRKRGGRTAPMSGAEQLAQSAAKADRIRASMTATGGAVRPAADLLTTGAPT